MASRAGWELGNSRTLRWLGRYSFGLYLIHYPVLWVLDTMGVAAAKVPAFAGSQLPGQLLMWLGGGSITLALSMASYHFFEAPLLRLRRFVTAIPSNAPIERDTAGPGRLRAPECAES